MFLKMRNISFSFKVIDSCFLNDSSEIKRVIPQRDQTSKALQGNRDGRVSAAGKRGGGRRPSALTLPSHQTLSLPSGSTSSVAKVRQTSLRLSPAALIRLSACFPMKSAGCGNPT